MSCPQPLKPYLILWVGDHGRFPLSIHVLVPVIRLLGIGVRDGLWLVPFLETELELSLKT